jgi:hypothetical protein
VLNGCMSLCDGGYHNWLETMSGRKLTPILWRPGGRSGILPHACYATFVLDMPHFDTYSDMQMRVREEGSREGLWNVEEALPDSQVTFAGWRH